MLFASTNISHENSFGEINIQCSPSVVNHTLGPAESNGSIACATIVVTTRPVNPERREKNYYNCEESTSDGFVLSISRRSVDSSQGASNMGSFSLPWRYRDLASANYNIFIDLWM